MKLKIRAFGIAREIVGGREFELEVSDQASVRQLKSLLYSKYPPLMDLSSMYIALNNDYAEDDIVLSVNDEIALIPPVSGG